MTTRRARSREGSRPAAHLAAIGGALTIGLWSRAAFACPFCGGAGTGETTASWLVIGAVVFFILRRLRKPK
jgi:hypothetical protein